MPPLEANAITVKETAYLAMLAEQDAEYLCQLGNRTGSATIRDWQDELADRAEKHVAWHIARGEARCLHAALVEAAQEAMLDALADITAATDDAERDTAFEEAHDALSNWKLVTENEADTPAAMLQCVELDQGALRSILRSMVDLECLSRAERDGTMTPLQIAMDVAAVGFAAASGPPHGIN